MPPDLERARRQLAALRSMAPSPLVDEACARLRDLLGEAPPAPSSEPAELAIVRAEAESLRQALAASKEEASQLRVALAHAEALLTSAVNSLHPQEPAVITSPDAPAQAQEAVTSEKG